MNVISHKGKMEVGEKVVYKYGGIWGGQPFIQTIKRDTKTQWILENGNRFKKDTLKEIGNNGYISEVTNEILEAIKLNKKLSTASCLMDDLGRNRNHIKTKNIKDIGVAIGKMIEVKKLLGII